MATKKPKRSGSKEVTQTKKVAHNVVECRRKQRISQSVEVLSHLVTPCDCGKKTRAEILQKAVEKIQELEETNKGLEETINGQTHDGGPDESLLQTKLALTVLEHLHLILSIIDHNERSKPTTITTTTMKPSQHDKSKTISNERLGFAVENLLEPSFERTHNHYYLQDPGCIPVTMTTTQRTDIDPCFSNNHLELSSASIDLSSSHSSSLWYHHHQSTTNSSYYNNINPYYSFESPVVTDWSNTPQLPPLHHHHHYTSSRGISQLGGSEGGSERDSVPTGPPQPMWRPYNNDSHPPPNTATAPLSIPLPPLPPHSTAVTVSNGYQQQPPSTSFLVGQLLENI